MTALSFSRPKRILTPMGKTALITGASRGIGRELAILSAKDQCRVALVARDAAALKACATELKTLGAADVMIIAADLSDPTVPDMIYKKVTAKKWSVDVLINNAGFATYGPFAKTDLSRELEELQVNIVALTQLTKLFLPAMIKKRSGRILNVASTAAFQAGPLMAVYYASKSYVLHFSEALHHELRGTGVTVTTLCPGPTDTGFVKAAHMEKSKLFKKRTMDAADVAYAGYRGMNSGKRIVIPGFIGKLQLFGLRLVPRWFVLRVVEYKQSA